jgi:hypothetical protein
LSVFSSEFTGNVTEQMEPGIPAVPDGSVHALAGLALVRVGQVDLEDVDLSGFASAGALFVHSTVEWQDGEVHHLVGTGVHAMGQSHGTLRDLSIHHIWGGATPFGYGLVASDGAHLVTERVTIEDSKTAGMLMNQATGEHVDIGVRRNGSRGVMIQNCVPDRQDTDAVVFSGTQNAFEDNGGVAFFVFQSQGISLSSGSIDTTSKVPMIPYGKEVSDSVQIGDGIEIIGSDRLAFSDLSLNSNARAGVIVDSRDNLQESTEVSFSNVTIAGEGDRGFVEQFGAASSAPEVTSPDLQAADELGGDLDVAKDLESDNIPAPDDIIDIET